jgi:hypothetical protein
MCLCAMVHDFMCVLSCVISCECMSMILCVYVSVLYGMFLILESSTLVH